MTVEEIFGKLREAEGWLILDTETTGLSVYRGDRVFLVTLMRGGVGPFSLDWNPVVSDLLNALVRHVPGIVGQNIKFDMHMLEAGGVNLDGVKTWDTATMERVRTNDEMSYSLDACGERIGIKKDTDFKKYLDKQKHYTMKKGRKHYHFDRAPRDMLHKYADQDVRVTAALYEHQRETFRDWDKTSRVTIRAIVALEIQTTPILYQMEKVGVKLDSNYCLAALEHEKGREKSTSEHLKSIIKQPFVDSAKALEPIFKAYGLPHGTTEKGNPSFTTDVLEPLRDRHPIISLILEHRDAIKRGTTYFEGMLYECGQDGRLHADMCQYGTATGRLSNRNPNLQNVPADETCLYPVRKALVADPGYQLLSLDYAAMEVRLPADLSGDRQLIDAIHNGIDIHQLVADAARVPRNIAKNVRFASQYGAGITKISSMLKTDSATVSRTIQCIKDSTPVLTQFTAQLVQHAKIAPYITNLYGRRYYFKDRRFTYKAANYYIQGSCADILRKALYNCAKVLRGKHSKLVLSIHDEVVILLHHSEQELIHSLRCAVRDAYTPVNGLHLDVSAYIGQNLHDMEPISAT